MTNSTSSVISIERFQNNIHFKPEMQANSENGSSNPKYRFVTFETQIIWSLRRVLYAFALHSPRIGYTQSLNFITGLLLFKRDVVTR